MGTMSIPVPPPEGKKSVPQPSWNEYEFEDRAGATAATVPSMLGQSRKRVPAVGTRIPVEVEVEVLVGADVLLAVGVAVALVCVAVIVTVEGDVELDVVSLRWIFITNW
jgi:hypothetical protein